MTISALSGRVTPRDGKMYRVTNMNGGRRRFHYESSKSPYANFIGTGSRVGSKGEEEKREQGG